MSKKDDAPAISLFSFQDLITSITGIMFLVVLLLVLLIATQKSGGDSGHQIDTAPLQKKIDEIRKAIRDQKAEQTRLNEKIRKLQKLDPDTLEARLRNAEEKIYSLQTKQDITERIVRQLADQVNAAEKAESSEQDQIRKFRAGILLKKKNILRYRKLKEAFREAEKTRKLLVQYAVPEKKEKVPVIVECSGRGLRVLHLSAGETHDFRGPPDSPIIETGKFLAWAKKRDPEKEYFVLMIQPAAFQYAESLNSILNSYGFQRGLEILPENTTSVFAEEGGTK